MCEECELDRFSFDPKGGSCDVCSDSDELFCPGSFQITPREGYWVSSWNSAEVHQC